MGIEFIISNNTIVLGQRKEQSRALACPRRPDRRGGTARLAPGDPHQGAVPARQSSLGHPRAGSRLGDAAGPGAGRGGAGPSALCLLCSIAASRGHQPAPGIRGAPGRRPPSGPLGPGRAAPPQSPEYAAIPPSPQLRSFPVGFHARYPEKDTKESGRGG